MHEEIRPQKDLRRQFDFEDEASHCFNNQSLDLAAARNNALYINSSPMTPTQKTDNNTSMSEPQSPAKNELLLLLARRDYSEKELLERLSQKFSSEETEVAIHWAQQNHWLKAPTELAAKIAERLNQKMKGIDWINQTLQAKGLPLMPCDPELELEKARHLIQNKPATTPEKLMRFLVRHGFEVETAGKVIYEKR